MNRKEQEKQLEIAKECLLDELKEQDEIVEDLLIAYDDAAERLKANIQKILVKFMEDNNLTMEQARGLLSSKEFTTWKKSIKKYIEDLADGHDTKMQLELRTLSAKSRISRNEQLLSEIDRELSTLANNTNKAIRKHLESVLVTNYYRGFYSIQKTVQLGFKVSKINHQLVASILEYPWSTKQFSKTIWENTDKLADTLRKELASGFIDGSSLQKMTKRIDEVMKKGKYVTERVVRTEAKFFAQQAQLMSYQKMGIEEYMYRGAGCPKCAAINGRKFNTKDAEVGVNCPPMHPNCKCRIIAIHEMSLFDMERNVVPLEENINFQKWKKKFINDNKT